MSREENHKNKYNLLLAFPCLACPYAADDPHLILEHYQKQHDFQLEKHAIPLQTPSQIACPLCMLCMEPSPNLLFLHYQNDHDMTMVVEGDKVTEDMSMRRMRDAEKQSKETEIPTVVQHQEDEQDELEEEEDEEEEENEEDEEEEREEESTPREEPGQLSSTEAAQKINELIEMFSGFVKNYRSAQYHH